MIVLSYYVTLEITGIEVVSSHNLITGRLITHAITQACLEVLFVCQVLYSDKTFAARTLYTLKEFLIDCSILYNSGSDGAGSLAVGDNGLSQIPRD